MEQLTTLDWTLAALAIFILGLSKAGIKGISIAAVTLMAMVFGGKASTGIIMPMLIAGDIFAVIYYKRHVRWEFLKKLLPWMVFGVLIGVWVGKDLPETTFKQGMAIIILLTVGMLFWWDRQKDKRVPDYWWFSGIMGWGAGFTTMIGNLAGAFSNIYFLSMRLPKNEFIGTAAWLFFIINLFKLPFHIWVWETINWSTVQINLYLLLALFLGLLLGINVVKKIENQTYRKMILILTALGAIAIFFR